MIKPSFAEDMLHYFMLSDELDHNTSMKYVKNAKQVLTTATGRWMKSNPIRDFHCTYHQPEREVLTMQEIMAIYEKSLIDRLDQVRDVFLFSCFTGLAYQEVYNLTKNEIVLGNDPNKWIKINRVKTGNPEDVTLLPIPEAIIEKYKNDKYCMAFNKLLPTPDPSGRLLSSRTIAGFRLSNRASAFFTVCSIDTAYLSDIINDRIRHKS